VYTQNKDHAIIQQVEPTSLSEQAVDTSAPISENENEKIKKDKTSDRYQLQHQQWSNQQQAA
jgi:hypothetical protein